MEKRIRIFFAAVTFSLLSSMAVQADDLFQLAWRGTSYMKDEAGNLVARPLTEREFINDIAQRFNISPRDLVFVWRANKLDTAVVLASTGEFVANVMQMEFVFTEVSNPSQTTTARQAFLFDEYHDAALGSAVGIERLRLTSSGALAAYSFRGTFNYAYPDQGRVVSGSFSTGKRVVERF